MKGVYWICTVLLAFSGWVSADEIYKSVDEQGNVTYSSKPPDNSVGAEAIDVAPGPSADSVKQAQEAHKKTQDTANSMAQDRQQREGKREEERKKAQAEADAQKSEEIIRHDESYTRYPYHWQTPIIKPRPPRPVHPIEPAPTPRPPRRPIAVPLPSGAK